MRRRIRKHARHVAVKRIASFRAYMPKPACHNPSVHVVVTFRLVALAITAASVLLMPAPLRAQITQDPTTGRVTLPRLDALPTPPARVPIYYPPEPPPPGGESTLLATLQTVGWNAPPELAVDVGEPFYPPLGSVLAEKTLTRKLRGRLDEYRRRRQTALEALRAGLRQQPAAIPNQEELLGGLERDAEKLRDDLTSAENAWNFGRRWRVPDETVDERMAGTREYNLLRAATFYRDGLSPAHRRLLRDFVIALGRTQHRAEAFPPPAVGPGAVLFFHPETAQIRLPITLPPELAAGFAAYVKTKHTLQLELVRAILTTDTNSFTERQRVFAKLSTDHAPRLHDLEATAENLRVALARVPPLTLPPLPAEFVRLTSSLRDAREQLNHDIAARLSAVRREHLRYTPGCETMTWETNFAPGAEIAARDLPRGPLELFAQVRETPLQSARFLETKRRLDAAIVEFRKQNDSQIKAVGALRDEVFAAGQRVFFPQHVGGPLPEEAAARLAQALQLYEREDALPKYREYLAAVQQPGLSPAQRRLLFNAALVELELPLPPGVRRPINQFDAP
jgi:hypothetical protein